MSSGILKRMRKSISLIVVGILIVFAVSFLFYDYQQLTPFLFKTGNVNAEGIAIDSVWYNPGNGYHNDTLINTILSDKMCIYNQRSWYADYFKLFSKISEADDSIPDGLEVTDYNLEYFTDIGYCLAYIHATLVDHKVADIINERDVPHLYVCTDGIVEADRILAFNDDIGNIYLIAEDVWNGQN